MGVLIDFIGLANGFYAIGIIVVTLLMITSIWLAKMPNITNADR
jgi:hypothetical protein